MAGLRTILLVCFFALLLVAAEASGKKGGKKNERKKGGKTAPKKNTKKGTSSVGTTANKGGVTISSAKATDDEDDNGMPVLKIAKAKWNGAKCPTGLANRYLSACTSANCSKGGVPGMWSSSVIAKNKMDGSIEVDVGHGAKDCSTLSPAACCNKCAATPSCTNWQFIPKELVEGNGNAKYGKCYLMKGDVDASCGEVSAQYENKDKPVRFQVRIGGECNPEISDDPHLIGARGTHFDFNGRPEKSFCLITDQDIHVNMLLRGYYDDRTEGAALVVDGKAVHTWIKELGLIWRAAGVDHKLRLAARDGKQQQRGIGFMRAIEVDGAELPRMQVGDVFTGPGGLTISFQAYEKEGPYDVDYYKVKINGLAAMDVRLRVAHPLLQTPADAEAHINVGLTDLEYTEEVHGVLGQTYRADHEQRAVNFQRLVAAMHQPISADGPNGAGFLDGSARSYETSGVMAPDCSHTAFLLIPVAN